MFLQVLRELQRVSGIGVKQAKELKDLGITDLLMLSARTELLNAAQKIGLKYALGECFYVRKVSI